MTSIAKEILKPLTIPRKLFGFIIFFSIISNRTKAPVTVPSIAQLVERRTVEVKLSSLGRWFESGSKESFFFSLNSFSVNLPSILGFEC